MSRFDSESLNAPHTQRHLDEIPQRTAPSVEQMESSALARAESLISRDAAMLAATYLPDKWRKQMHNALSKIPSAKMADQ